MLSPPEAPPKSEFDVVVESDRSPTTPADFDWSSLYELIFGGEDESRTVMMGEVDGERVAVDPAMLQCACVAVRRWMKQTKLRAGDTVAAVRIEGGPELPLAAWSVAMMVNGLRVFLPMGYDTVQLCGMVDRVDAAAVVTAVDGQLAADRSGAEEALSAICEDCGARLDYLGCDLEVFVDEEVEDFEDPQLDSNRQVAVFSTSGSTGTPKLVPYTERALLGGMQAWEDAGLFSKDRLGGDTVVPLLAHTMGFRHLLCALWNRQCALFIRPEWLDGRPYRVVSQLLERPPNHITCGPALLEVFAEYLQHFPVLRERLEPNLRCIASSGTAVWKETGELFDDVEFANAFGTTETQQVLNTLVGDTAQPGELGRPLPGVRVGVRLDDSGKRRGRLFVSSPFGGEGVIDERGELQPFGEWYDTGDVVRVDDGSLYFVGRADADFLNTGIGVKVARAPLEEAYADLVDEVRGFFIEACPKRRRPVAVAFVDGDSDSEALQQRIADAAAFRAQQLASEGHDVAFGRVPPAAVGLVEGRPPRRGPGKVDRRKLRRRHPELFEALYDPDDDHPRVVDVPEAPESPKRRLYPRLSRLIEALRLDVDFREGRGNTLVRTTPEGPREVLDMTGGYGANLLGHGRRDLREAAVEALDGVPMLDQVSGRRATDEFAEQLALRVGRHTGRRWVVVPASTGAEAVDRALQHAAAVRTHRIEDLYRRMRRRFGASHPSLVEKTIRANCEIMESRRPTIVALESSFHGTTVGATHALSNEEHRRALSPLLGADTVFLDPRGGPEARRRLERIVDENTVALQHLVVDEKRGEVRSTEQAVVDILATIAEPIIGEGGIVEVPHDWLCELKIEGVPLIVDEIQSGLGRSGRFLASTDPETGRFAPADCILLGKALGGGVAKISTLLVERSHYLEKFDEMRSSTFAEDCFSSSVASTVLEVIERDDVPARAGRAGDKLRSRLEELQEAYPEVVVDIRGRGLMLGVELAYPNDPPSTVLRSVAGRGLGYLAASYLLHRQNLRILPTSSAPEVLRLEPSAYLTDDEIDAVVDALEPLCEALATSNAFELLSHLVDGPPEEMEQKRFAAQHSAGTEAVAPDWIEREEPADGARRVAFVHHPMHPSKEMIADAPVAALFSTEQRLELGDLVQLTTEFQPLVSFSRNFLDGEIWMAGITVMATPLVMEQMYRTGRTDLIVDRLQEAVELAAELGCEALTLGAFTSIVTDDGTQLYPVDDVELSSGNTFTAAVTLHQLREACETAGIGYGPRAKPSVGVVGALGNIGRALVENLMVHELPSARFTLFGRQGSDDRLKALCEQLDDRRREGGMDQAEPIEWSTDLTDLREVDIALVAVNAAEPIVFARHIADDRPVIIADVSEPAAVDAAVSQMRPDAHLIDGGLVRVPGEEDFQLSLDAPPGALFACAAEALLMAMSDEKMELTGDIRAENVRRLYEEGRRLGLFDAIDSTVEP